jgi:hypothetical protein
MHDSGILVQDQAMTAQYGMQSLSNKITNVVGG